jgi:GNAT superfamily N-acetyltransferase
MINRDFQYTVSPEIRVSPWKDVPQKIKDWAISIWEDIFKSQRNFMGDDDLFIWIPRVATLFAKHGRWIGESKSFYAVYVTCNYVDADYRGQGISGNMILTMANKATEIWGPTPFLFEVQDIPRGLVGVEPLLRFSYVWIPFVDICVPPRWKRVDISIVKGYHGFHVDSTEGYQCFSHNGQIILLDSLNDIIYYTDALVLHTFDGIQLGGAWCRFFSPWGSTRVFLHNMYFDPLPSMKHYMLT